MKIKVFAPDGTVEELTGWARITIQNQGAELFLVREGFLPRKLSKKVVVQNLETGEVIYDPRYAPQYLAGVEFLKKREIDWLSENPQWPRVLELEGNPVDEEENDGLYA